MDTIINFEDGSGDQVILSLREIAGISVNRRYITIIFKNNNKSMSYEMSNYTEASRKVSEILGDILTKQQERI